MSFMVISVIAATTTATGSTSSFWYGLKKYSNYAQLKMNGTKVWGCTRIECLSAECEAGYLGVSSKLYRETSSGSGTYYLVYASPWNYNSKAVYGLGIQAEPVSDLPSGDYMSQGKTAVYYDGGYQYNFTHITPFIQIIN